MRAARRRHCENPASVVSAFLTLLSCLLLSGFASSQVQVVTEHNDVSRSGANTNETVLTLSNVNLNTFGKLFTQSVDGFVVGQPLYLSAVRFPNGSTHNVVYVATQHDSVFAFDADSSQSPLWSVSFINPAAGITTVPMSDYGCAGTAFTEIGIVSTPVIDPAADTLFVVAKTLENGAYIYRLHALSVTTGADVITPEVLSASVPTISGTLQFDPAIEMQRPALLLENGTIYVGFGSNGCDTYAYHGWLLAYSESSLQPVAAYATTPNSTQGAIWQAGGGPAADTDGTIFLATANGTFDANTGGSDYGDSLLHLSPASAGLTVLDSFTPYDQATLDANDKDLGSGGVTLLPDQSAPHVHEMVGGGKEGTLYLVDRDSMGGYNPAGDTQIIQSIPHATTGPLVSVPAFWNGNVYVGAPFDAIKAFPLSNDLLATQPSSETTVQVGWGAGSVSITSNGSNNGILWGVLMPNPAVLYAFNASALGTMLYSSAQAGTRDSLGTVPKFGAPTIANGKVYVSGTSLLSVYGLFPQISSIAGNNQSAYVGTTLPLALQVETVDAYQGTPIPNASVTCKDDGVGGSFSSVMPMVTNSQGMASTSYTLPKKSQTITITCTSTGFVASTFSEVGVAGPVSRAAIIAGNRQTGPVSTPLPAALTVQVFDPYSYGVPGVPVTFSDGGAGGTFSAASVTTNSTGEASTSYTTPSTAGTVTISASTTGITPVKFAEVVTSTAPGFTLSPAPGTLSIHQGTSGTSTITVNPTNGFAGNVTLAATGLPAGVTALFSANPETTTSILTLTASSSATSGTATVTITGTSGGLTEDTTINLTVTAPSNFTLSAAPSTLSVIQGSSGTSTITVNPTNGFAGSVTLAASGLPAGVTALFSTNPASTTSILTLTAGSSATIGSAAVTVTGTSGSLTLTTTINLTVTAPPPPTASYSLSAGTPSPAAISPGGTSTAVITVSQTDGYTGVVNLSCTVTSTVTFTPSQATCTFGSTSPAAVTSSGGTATMTFSTVAASATMLRRSSIFYALWLPLPGMALIGCSFGSKGNRRKKQFGFLLLGMVLASLIVLPACGTSANNNGGGGGGTANGGTPAGTYTVTITGADGNGVAQSNAAPTVSVTVN
jgi:hypothetical protein